MTSYAAHRIQRRETSSDFLSAQPRLLVYRKHRAIYCPIAALCKPDSETCISLPRSFAALALLFGKMRRHMDNRVPGDSKRPPSYWRRQNLQAGLRREQRGKRCARVPACEERVCDDRSPAAGRFGP